MEKAAQRREKHEWAIEKPKLDCARNLRGIYSVDPSDENYKNIIKNARRKFETNGSSNATYKASIQKTVIPKTGKFKEAGAETEFSCIAEIDESTRKRIVFLNKSDS